MDVWESVSFLHIIFFCCVVGYVKVTFSDDMTADNSRFMRQFSYCMAWHSFSHLTFVMLPKSDGIFMAFEIIVYFYYLHSISYCNHLSRHFTLKMVSDVRLFYQPQLLMNMEVGCTSLAQQALLHEFWTVVCYDCLMKFVWCFMCVILFSYCKVCQFSLMWGYMFVW
jgi:hypothetical protein